MNELLNGLFPICMFCRFCAMEQNLPLMKLETGWWMSWGVSSRLCLLIFLHRRFPTCNRSNSYCYSPSCRHSCFFCCCKVGACYFSWCFVSQFFMSYLFLVGYFVNALFASTNWRLSPHMVLIECICLSCIRNMVWDVLQQRCKGNGGIYCRMGWTFAVFW
jgi:hypothetical protein